MNDSQAKKTNGIAAVSTQHGAVGATRTDAHLAVRDGLRHHVGCIHFDQAAWCGWRQQKEKAVPLRFVDENCICFFLCAFFVQRTSEANRIMRSRLTIFGIRRNTKVGVVEIIRGRVAVCC